MEDVHARSTAAEVKSQGHVQGDPYSKDCTWSSVGKKYHVETFTCAAPSERVDMTPMYLEANLERNNGDFQDWVTELESESTTTIKSALGEHWHTTEELLTEYQELTKDPSSPWKLSYLVKGDMKLPLLTTSSSPVELESTTSVLERSPTKNRIFIVAGEHAREAISTELGLAFVKLLAGKGPASLERGGSSNRVKEILQKSDISFLPIINMDGRRAVDQGDFCKRSNGHDVDLNRNYASNWGVNKQADAEPNNEGSAAFDQPETQIIRDYAKTFRADTFLSIHSGQEALFSPWAYDEKFPDSKDKADMERVLSTVNDKSVPGQKLVKDAKLGPAGFKLGYYCSGTSLDYMYDKAGTSKSFAFEIFNGLESVGGTDAADAASFLESETSERRLDNQFCLSKYFPNSKVQFDSTINKWTNAMMLTIECSTQDKC